jgi:Amino acid synthesis
MSQETTSERPTTVLPGTDVRIRKWVTHVEQVLADGGRATARPINRVVVAAVLENPYAGRWSADLGILVDAGEAFAVEVTTRALRLLDGNIQSYGKGGIVGEHGELEHVAALLHPKFGAPTRSLSEGVSILPSVKKRGGQGCSVDIPLHHKKAMLVRDYFDSIEFRVPDAPAGDEIVVAFATSDGPRPHPRVGGLALEDARGEDGLR